MIGPQKAYLSLGKWGCYFLCIQHIAGNNEDLTLNVFFEALQNGWIEEDSFVRDPEKLFLAFTGDVPCAMTKEGPEYETKGDELEILRFGWTTDDEPGKTVEHAHFVVGDGHGKVAWDPLGDYLVYIPQAKLVSKRIFRVT